jgi:threonine dehydrogenase-like Zn-dependent dehydrogenase
MDIRPAQSDDDQPTQTVNDQPTQTVNYQSTQTVNYQSTQTTVIDQPSQSDDTQSVEDQPTPTVYDFDETSSSSEVDQPTGKPDRPSPTMPDEHAKKKMNAVVWKKKKTVKLTKVPLPLITDDRDVIIKVTSTSICGSDMHLYDNSMSVMKKGNILGHEFMGTIHDKGKSVFTHEIGQRVVVSGIVACGTCDYCEKQQYTACSTTNPSDTQKDLFGHTTSALFGCSHMKGGLPGGQAEYVRVPYADVNCLRVPDELPDQKVLLLSDALCTSYYAADIGRVREGCTVAIWGLGPIGLLTARWCQIMGASTVIGIDCLDFKLGTASIHIGIETINYKTHDVDKVIKEFAPEGIDVCIECVGGEYAKTWKDRAELALGMMTDTSEIFTQMMRSVKKLGHISVVGDYIGSSNRFPVGPMMEKGVTIKCGQAPIQKYWNRVLQHIESGLMDPTFVLSHFGKLSDTPKFYDLLYERKDRLIKPFITVE